MKSYQNHLKDTRSFGEELKTNYKPTMRSSAVFPLIVIDKKIDSIYTFMGYWLRKRNISLVTALLTIRDMNGKKVNVKSYEINSDKSYVFRGSELINNRKKTNKFTGSMEVEIFSAVDMVFPFPAITFAFEGMNGLTFVHTCGRIYNDVYDMQNNEEITVPETGFDVLLNKKFQPFFSFVNGPIAIRSIPYEVKFIDQFGKIQNRKRILKNIPPFGLAWINIFKNIIERNNFKGEKLTIKIKHDFKGFFPRFVAGNVLNNFSDISLTHSYYDTSKDKSKSSIYKNPNPKKYYDSVISIPFDNRFDNIELAIYPNFSKSPCELSFQLFDDKGLLIKTSNKKILIADGKNKLLYIPLIKLFNNLESSPSIGMVKVLINGKGKIPTRIKFGLNLSKKNKDLNLPSNICFNAKVPNEKIIKKAGTFKWCALFSSQNQRIYLHNTSFVKNGLGKAKISIEVCREIDNKKLKWKIYLPQDGSKELVAEKLNKIDRFLNGGIGWLSAQCSNPFITGYYVTDFGKGVVGADHLY